MIHPWAPPPPQVGLAASEIHLWRATLDVEVAVAQRLYPLLNGAEQERAGRFRFERDRQRFIVARARLRQILSRYLNVSAQRIGFVYGPNGKPALSPGQAEGDIRFNLSHSRGLAVYAVTQQREIGVDIEVVRPTLAWRDLAERVFSKREKVVFRQTPEPMQCQLFFQGWTRKEAVLKAMGQGLALSLEQIEVIPTLNLLTGSGRSPGKVNHHPGWNLYDIEPAASYVGTVVAEHTQFPRQFKHYGAEHLALNQTAGPLSWPLASEI